MANDIEVHPEILAILEAKVKDSGLDLEIAREILAIASGSDSANEKERRIQDLLEAALP